MKTVVDLLIFAGRFLAGLWPLMFLSLFIGIIKSNKGFGISFRLVIKWLLISWGIFAMLHLVFFLLSMDTFELIPEPANSQAFLIVGLVLIPFAFAMVLESRQNHLTADSIAEMRSLSPSEFETLVANTYRAQGHSVEIVGAPVIMVLTWSFTPAPTKSGSSSANVTRGRSANRWYATFTERSGQPMQIAVPSSPLVRSPRKPACGRKANPSVCMMVRNS